MYNERQRSDDPIVVSIPKRLLDSLEFAIRFNSLGSINGKAYIERITMLSSALNSVYEYAEAKVLVGLSKICRLRVPFEICFDDRAERLTSEAISLLDQLINMIRE